MNKVFLKGNVGHTPKITNFENGGKVAQFTLATSETRRSRDDETKYETITDWHNIVVKRGGLAEFVSKYVQKGTPLLIEGKLKTREYDSQGVTKYITEIIAETIELCGGQRRDDAPAPAPAPEDARKTNDLPFD